MVPVVGVRTVVYNTPSPTGTQQQSSDELVEIKEEEQLHDDSLRRDCGEGCVSGQEGGGTDSTA